PPDAPAERRSPPQSGTDNQVRHLPPNSPPLALHALWLCLPTQGSYLPFQPLLSRRVRLLISLVLNRSAIARSHELRETRPPLRGTRSRWEPTYPRLQIPSIRARSADSHLQTDLVAPSIARSPSALQLGRYWG